METPCHTNKCTHVPKGKRTIPQNNSLHLFCTLLADEMNLAGYTIADVLEYFNTDVSWSMTTVKEIIWRKMQIYLLGKTSTRDLNKQEDIDRVYDEVNRFTSEKLHIHVPFPNDPDTESSKSMLKGEKIDNYPTEFLEPKL